RGTKLIIANAAIVKTTVAGDMLERAADVDMPTPLADDNRQLALKIQTLRHLRQNDRRFRPDNGRCEARKDRRHRRHLQPRLGRMISVVEPNADDLARLNRWQEL